MPLHPLIKKACILFDNFLPLELSRFQAPLPHRSHHSRLMFIRRIIIVRHYISIRNDISRIWI
jgi:hypothetical protein